MDKAKKSIISLGLALDFFLLIGVVIGVYQKVDLVSIFTFVSVVVLFVFVGILYLRVQYNIDNKYRIILDRLNYHQEFNKISKTITFLKSDIEELSKKINDFSIAYIDFSESALRKQSEEFKKIETEFNSIKHEISFLYKDIQHFTKKTKGEFDNVNQQLEYGFRAVNKFGIVLEELLAHKEGK